MSWVSKERFLVRSGFGNTSIFTQCFPSVALKSKASCQTLCSIVIKELYSRLKALGISSSGRCSDINQLRALAVSTSIALTSKPVTFNRSRSFQFARRIDIASSPDEHPTLAI